MNKPFKKKCKEAPSRFFIGNGGVSIPDFSKRFSFFFIIPVLLLGVVVVSSAQPLIPATDTMFQRYYPDLTVFIGTPVPNQSLNKDSTARWPNDPFMADGVLRVKYLVTQWVYGQEKPPDTLEMISYDHYSAFPFLDTKFAMLYVYKNKYGSYTQERYRYHNVYPTIGGGWAGPPEAWKWFRDSNHLVPQIIPYIDSVRVRMHVFEDSTYFPDELEDIRGSYPEPYYYLNKFDMVTMYGNDILELFNYEKGQLIESAIFDEKYVDENGVVSLPDVELNVASESDENQANEEVESPKELKLTFDQFKLFGKFYSEFIKAMKSENTVGLNQLLLPEIRVCDSIFNKNAYLNNFLPQIKVPFQKYRKVRNWEKIKEKDWKEWYENDHKDYEVFKDSLFNNYWIRPETKWIRPNLDFENPQNELFVLENYYPQNENQKEFYLHFVLRNGQFFLYGMHFTRMRHCYQ